LYLRRSIGCTETVYHVPGQTVYHVDLTTEVVPYSVLDIWTGPRAMRKAPGQGGEHYTKCQGARKAVRRGSKSIK